MKAFYISLLMSLPAFGFSQSGSQGKSDSLITTEAHVTVSATPVQTDLTPDPAPKGSISTGTERRAETAEKEIVIQAVPYTPGITPAAKAIVTTGKELPAPIKTVNKTAVRNK